MLSILLFLDIFSDRITTALLVLGLLVFGEIFTVNFSLHSYLILAFSKDARVTIDVGLYYMSNAVRRLIGTLLSGATYHLIGIWACLATFALMLVISALGVRQLTPDQ